MRKRGFLIGLGLILGTLPALSQQTQPPPAQFGQTLDVVATTPSDAWGVPRDQVPAKAGVELPLGKARLGLDLLYESARHLQGDEANLLKPLGGFSRLHLDLSHPIGRRLVGFVEMDNLLDRDYATFGLLGDPGDVLGEDVTDPRFLSPGAPRRL